MSDTIGDYYDRKKKELRAAWQKWQEAVDAHKVDPSEANYQAMRKAEQEAIDAGNTGD